jgi:membrane-bound lytic murein transglycosylase B
MENNAATLKTPAGAFAKTLLLCLCLGALIATSSRTHADETAPLVQSEPSPPGFDDWVAAVRADAAGEGISSQILDDAFRGLHYNARVVELSESQPEFSRPIWDYLDSAVSDTRIDRGGELTAEERDALARAAGEFAVPRSVIVAIWGIESNYGEITGHFNVVEALATLGFKQYHGTYGREQLLAALKILQEGDIAPAQMTGSWAGAMGQAQFIPTVFLRYARDGNGDGRRDIWGTDADVFASIANYLHDKSWANGLPCFDEVRLPSSFDYTAAAAATEKPVSEWANAGVTLAADGGPLTGGANQDVEAPATIALPAGHLGPAFVLYPNFKAVLAYNNAFSYGLAVCQLAKRLEHGPPFKTNWPREQVPLLSRTERIELQTMLAQHKYDAGDPDGVIGQRARRAIRDYQRAVGLVPDGYATVELLTRLRETPTN